MLALLQLRLLPSLALRISVSKNQVAATRKISLHPPPAAVDFSPSLTATRFELRISLRQRKKPPYWVAFVGGEGEIRTLEPLLTVTRFPIVRARPATRLLRNCSASISYFIGDSNIIPQNLRFVNTFLNIFLNYF